MSGNNQNTRRPSRRFSSNHASVPIPSSSVDDHAVAGSASPAAGSVLSGRGEDMNMDNPDPKIVQRVGRHLVPEEQGFDSLQLQGGDITREIYNWQREHRTNEGEIKRGRSRSFDVKADVHPDVGQARDIRVPGGFRRDYVASHLDSESIASNLSPQPSPANYGSTADNAHSEYSPSITPGGEVLQQHVFTRNFIEFLSLYGHFAGEELEDEEDESDEDESDEGYAADTDNVSESNRLLRPSRQLRHPRRTPQRVTQQAKGQASTLETVMLLLKSFVGTGVLFLPKAFYNGGLLFSSSVMVFVSLISYWCFMLLVSSKEYTKQASFGDIGGVLYGERVRLLILGCIVVSQIGFASAYIIFVAENLMSFFASIKASVITSSTEPLANVSTFIVLQLIVFLPLSMIRDIAKLGFTALIADAFILAGLAYLYSWSGFTLLTKGVADVAMFNSQDWTLFIGTAVFTYEGIGLIIPIQESMRNPKHFGPVLGGVMIGITVVFVSVGALLYAATGSSVETVILLNLPRGGMTSTVQLLYSIAILLSTPLQLFPAIRILENALFVRSGKFSKKVKWEKNVFRFLLVGLTGCVAYMGADDLDKFVALIGSVACVPLVYIFPPVLHLRTVAAYSYAFYFDVVLAIFGVCIMAYTSSTTIMAWGS